MCDEECALPGAVVVQHIHDLYCSVGLAGTWRAHDHGQARLYAGHDSLDLRMDGWVKNGFTLQVTLQVTK